MEKECRKYIIDLHVFIESWLIGSLEKSNLEFQRFKDALDTDFVIIHPSGELQTKPSIISDFWKAYGIRSESFKIEILDVDVRFMSEDVCIMNYKECQFDVDKSVRISTVIFRKSLNSDKIYWLHLHETWCPIELIENA